jgi:fatty-acyl-CoA synthase
MPFFDHINVPYLVKREGLPPGKIAIRFEERTRTYGELRDQVLRVANALSARGVKKGDRVAVVLHNCLEFWEINFGIQETGAIVVPLNSRLAPMEIANLVRRSGARVVFFDKEHLAHVDAVVKETEIRHRINVGDDPPGGALGYEALVAAAEAKPLDVRIGFDDPAEIIYTSGTTGVPKGAIWTHGTVLANSIQQCMDYGLTSRDNTYITLGMFYVGGRHDFTIPVFHQGGTVHVRRTGGFDAGQVLDYIRAHAISVILLVPTMLYDVHRLPEDAKRDLGCVRMIMCGGAPVPVPIIEKTMAVFPNAAFVQVFGSTEAGATVTQLVKEDSIRKIGSVGKPTLHNLVCLVDDAGTRVPTNEVGEIAVKGPAVIKGYWENDAATRQALGGGFLRTGDLGRFDEEGYLYIVGRKKDMIISGALNIYPEEIEDVLRRHPGVADVAVIGVPDERWGESVMAIVKPSTAGALTAEEVIEHCRRHLAGYKKPRYVEFVDSFPRTQSGKIQKFALREAYRRAGSGN